MKSQLNKLISEYRNLQPINENCKKTINSKFRLEFNYNSNHLEGNTLTYGETKLLLLFDQTKGNHELREYEEMKAHDVALLMVEEETTNKDKPLTEKFIKDLNHTILVRPFWKDAMTPDGQSTRRLIKVGEYKEYPNSVIQTNGEVFEYALPQETPILMADLVKWYNTEIEKKELSPIELAALLHYRYIRIHPFDDGNGRVARLLVNYVLYYYDLPPVIIKTEDKRNYLRALQQADSGDLNAFINYMSQQLAWSLNICIKAAKGEDIEEQNDWEKQLSLLKKGLGDKTENVIKISDDIMIKFYEEVLTPFCHIYEQKISQFDSLFMSRETLFDWNLNKYVSKDVNCIELLEKLRTDVYFPGTELIIICSFFYTLRKPYINSKIASFPISFMFDKNAYKIEYNKQSITKLYSDFPSADEMENIVSDIGKDLVKKIEEAINS